MKTLISIKKQSITKHLGAVVIFLLLLTATEDCVFASPVNPVYDSQSGTTKWDYVYFGSYPQTEVTDGETITAIEANIEAANKQADFSAELSSENQNEAEGIGGENTSTGISVWVDGIKYSRIQEKDVTNADNFDTTQSYRYFKWQRIKWKVLKNDGNTLFLMADQALDCKPYHESKQDITWENSTLRNWLNGYGSGENDGSADNNTDSFLKTAFAKEEQDAIIQTKVNNSNNPRFGTSGGNVTTDYIYLLSLEETSDGSYGLSNESVVALASCQTTSSDFAYRRGVTASTSTGKEGNCSWWLRSPGMYGYDVSYVNYGGFVNSVGLINTYDNLGVCPVLHIALSSDEWKAEDDGTSGAGGVEKTLTDLQVCKEKTVYNQGEDLQVDDLTVIATYSHTSGDSQKELSSNAYITNADTIDMNTPGTKTLTISCTKGDATKSVNILLTVNEKESSDSENTQDDTTNTDPEKEQDTQDGTTNTDSEKEQDTQDDTMNTNPEKEQNTQGEATNTIQEQEANSQNPTVEVEKLVINSPSLKLASGKKIPLTVTIIPANATSPEVRWKTSNKKYATVNKKGILTLKKAGSGKKVTIMALAQDGSGKTASIKIKIMKDAVKSVKIKAPKKTLQAGKSMTIKAEIKTTGKSANRSLVWKSSNTQYATVSKKGKVTAKKAGKGKKVTITATTTDGSNKKASVKIKIK